MAIVVGVLVAVAGWLVNAIFARRAIRRNMLSTTSTLLPASLAVSVADRPAAPDPSTTTS